MPEKYVQLKYHERTKIYSGMVAGFSKAAIARSIGRYTSTVIREIEKNRDHNWILSCLCSRSYQKAKGSAREQNREGPHAQRICDKKT